MNIHIELKRLEQQFGSDPATQGVYRETVKLLLKFVEEIHSKLNGLNESTKDTRKLLELSGDLVKGTSGLSRYLVETVSKCFQSCENPEEIEEAREYLLKYLQLKYEI